MAISSLAVFLLCFFAFSTSKYLIFQYLYIMYWRGDWRLAQDMQQAIMKLILSEKSKQFIKMHKKPPINPSFFLDII
jgi:hypothetical protein